MSPSSKVKRLSHVEHDLVKPSSGLQKFQNFLLAVSVNKYFNTFITGAIIGNTICLALDKYPPDLEESNLLDIFNLLFFAIFFAEMLIKIAGMGPKIYVQDPFNNFDAVIVSLSIIDVVVSYSSP